MPGAHLTRFGANRHSGHKVRPQPVQTHWPEHQGLSTSCSGPRSLVVQVQITLASYHFSFSHSRGVNTLHRFPRGLIYHSHTQKPVYAPLTQNIQSAEYCIGILGQLQGRRRQTSPKEGELLPLHLTLFLGPDLYSLHHCRCGFFFFFLLYTCLSQY